ncbi:hypothetical protein HK099_006478 [Clydaea vesicula]|uniref:Protein MON2 homolog n=1 Tax=Clydaea vesicula TaxID=447962 RepID=A0AAD5XY62_9FUNG|nr:hypothetical protein HK099_006478 [Clydaea vesicula]
MASMLANFLQTELLNLSNEAKKKYPEIKEASERLLYILRALKDRGSNSLPGVDVVAIELSKTADVVKPFILACETKQVKLVTIAVSCLQKLISHHAVPENSIPLVLQTLEIVNNQVDMQLKILQTVLPLLTHYEIVHNDILADALYLCFRLQDSKNPIVQNTAAATIRQLVIHVFEKVVLENLKDGNPDEKSDHLSPCAKDAYLLFLDLFILTSGEAPEFLKKVNLSKSAGLELIESVLTNHYKLFKTHPKLLQLLKEKVCPLIIRSFSEKNDFLMAVRLMRVVQKIIKHFHDVLHMEGEIFLSLLSKLMEPDHAPFWQRIIVVEIYRDICNEIDLIRSIFKNFDMKDHSTRIIQDMVSSFSKIIVSEKSSLLVVNNLENNAQGEYFALSVTTSSVKMQSIDQLDKNEPPAVPETYLIYLALTALTNLIDGLSKYIQHICPPGKGPSNEVLSTEESNEILLAIEMPKNIWAAVLATLSFLVNASVDDEIFCIIIKNIQNFTIILGVLGLTTQRDAFLNTICKSGVPQTKGFSDSQVVKELKTETKNNSVALQDRNVVALRALLNISQTLTTVLDDKSWFLILETLQTAEGLVSTGKTLSSKKEGSSASLVKEDYSKFVAKQPSFHNNNTLENLYMNLVLSIKKFFETSTKIMDEKSFFEFIKALCKLAKDSCAVAGIALSSSKDTMKVAEEKSFAIARIHDLAIFNVSRLISSKKESTSAKLGPSPFQIWDLIINQLIEISHQQNCPISIRQQVCVALSEILTVAIQTADMTDPLVEMKIFQPLKVLLVVDREAAGDTGLYEEKERIIKSPWFTDLQKWGLEILNKLLQTSGQNVTEGWSLVFDIVGSVIGNAVKLKRLQNSDHCEPQIPSTGTEETSAGSGTSAGGLKSASLVKVAFPCLQLICTDFLSLLKPSMLLECIETLGCFGSKLDDLNISLTAISLLWSVSDYVLTRKQQLENTLNGSDNAERVPMNNETDESVASRSMATSRTITMSILNGPETKKTWDTLWMFLLANFSELCSDQRPEVRNTANQTLFRTISMNGQKLIAELWSECLWNVLFPLLERVKTSSENLEILEKQEKTGTPLTKTSNLMVHHSRNTASKQWDETKVLTLSGVTKCYIDFFPVLINLIDFDKAWKLFLDYIKECFLNGSPEVSMAAIKSFKTLVRYPKDVDEGIITENVRSTFLFLWTVAWETWESIGLGIITTTDENKQLQSDNKIFERKILHGPLDQNSLTAYVNVFIDVFPMISSVFGLEELRRLFLILSLLPLYHSNPLPGATSGRHRLDAINDLDVVSPLQSVVLELASSGNLVNSNADLSSHIDFFKIDRAPEIILPMIAGLSELPFLRQQQINISPSSPNNIEKGFTYIALSKRGMQLLVTLFEKYGGLKSLYLNETTCFSRILSSLGLGMKCKYECPAVGIKDTTPLWKFAATSFLTILKIGLDSINLMINDLDPLRLNDIYTTVLDIFQSFLLSKSNPPGSLSQEELSADEAFDISVLTSIEMDVFIHLGQNHVEDEILKKMIMIIYSGSRLYYPRENLTSFERLSETNMRPKINNNIVGPTLKVEVSEKYALGTDIVLTGREDFARSCLSLLFGLCSNTKEDFTDIRKRIAGLVIPHLLEKSRYTLKTYATDKPLFGKCPLPRIRNEELIFILTHLEKTNLINAIFKFENETKNKIKKEILSGPCALLFSLYFDLIDLLSVVSKSGVNNSNGDEEIIVDSVKNCLRRVGKEFGLER